MSVFLSQMLTPSNRISPLLGCSSRFRQRRKVLFPPPGRADDADDLAPAENGADIVQHGQLPELLGQVVHVNHFIISGHGAASSPSAKSDGR